MASKHVQHVHPTPPFTKSPLNIGLHAYSAQSRTEKQTDRKTKRDGEKEKKCFVGSNCLPHCRWGGEQDHAQICFGIVQGGGEASGGQALRLAWTQKSMLPPGGKKRDVTTGAVSRSTGEPGYYIQQPFFRCKNCIYPHAPRNGYEECGLGLQIIFEFRSFWYSRKHIRIVWFDHVLC